MHSTKNILCKVLFFVLLYVIVDSNARTTSQSSNHDNHRRQNGHIYHRARTTSRKRRVVFHITDAMSRKSDELRRIAFLNGIMKDQGPGDQSVKMYPRPAPHTKVAHSAMDQHNDQSVNGGVGMRIVSNKPSRTPKSVFNYFKRLQQQRDAAAASKACHELQKLLAGQNIRVRMRCTSDPHYTSIPQLHTVYHNK